MTSFQHVQQNLKSYGFYNHEAALLQSVKELIENSLDSFKASTNIDEAKVSVVIAAHPLEPNWLQVTVTDNGCGMDDALACLNCFATNKSSEAEISKNYFGCYGLGLFCVLVYLTQPKQMTRHLTLVTKTNQNCTSSPRQFTIDCSEGRVVEVPLSPTSQNHANQNTEIATSGTQITITMKQLDSKHSGKQFLAKLAWYLEKMTFLPTRISLEVSIQLYGCNHFSFSSKPTIVGSLIDTIEYNKIMANNIQHQLKAQEVLVHSETMRKDDNANSLSLTTTLMLISNTILNAPCSFKPSQDNDEIPIHVWRFVNDVPLLSEDGGICGLLQAFTKVKWADSNCKLKHVNDVDSTNTAWSVHIPSWMLTLNDVVESNQRYSLLVVLSISQKSVWFCNMMKIAITPQKCLDSVVSNALSQLMQSLQLQCAQRDISIFQTTNQRKRIENIDFFLPLVCKSLSKIIGAASTKEFQDNQLSKLGYNLLATNSTGHFPIDEISNTLHDEILKFPQIINLESRR